LSAASHKLGQSLSWCRRAAPSGFTLLELLVVLAMLGMLFLLVVPNLGAVIPSARLRGSGTRLQRELDWVRSEARIQGKQMVMELDLEKARWRIVLPPEQRLTRDQDLSMLEERPESWWDLEDDVVFAGAGDGKNGMTTRSRYRIVFDEYGFTADQIVALKLQSNPQLTWGFTLIGLSGRVIVEEAEDGSLPELQFVSEGAF
jgi:prepilin-type N-terminal cleavage/methylation domain-containing protein